MDIKEIIKKSLIIGNSVKESHRSQEEEKNRQRAINQEIKEKSKLVKALKNQKRKEVKSILTDSSLPNLSGNLTNVSLPNNFVGIPFYFTKSSIYAPRDNKNRGDRNVDIPIWTQNNIEVRYKGPELDTKIDYKLLSILLKAMDLAKFENNIVILNYKETLKTLGLNPQHPDARHKFNQSIERHLSAKFMFGTQDGKEAHWKTIFNSDNTYVSYSNNIIKIELNDIVRKLFNNAEANFFTIEDMMLSFGIKNSYAIKLYSYYESNTNPYPVKLSTLFKICDKPIKIKDINGNHKAVIRKAMNELVDLGFLESWVFKKSKSVGDPLVYVNKIKKEEREVNTKLSFPSNYLNYEE